MRGLWHEPRLLKDWDDVSKSTGAALSSQELFFNVCFAVIIGGLRARLQADLEWTCFATRFLGVWALISNAADYATRFNDEDLYHKIWWAGYGVGLVGMVMHMKGGPVNESLFHGAAAFTHCWIAMSFLRVGISLKRCRVFCSYFACVMLVTAVGWIWAVPRELLVPVALSPIAATAFAFLVPRHHDLPMNIEYHVAKFTGLKMLLLGQPVVALAVTPNASGDPTQLYGLALASLALVLCLKLLIFDCDVVALPQHAIRQERRTALLWIYVCQPGIALLIASTAAGLGGVMDAVNNANEPESHRQHPQDQRRDGHFLELVFAARASAPLLCSSLGWLLLVLLLTQYQHKGSGQPFGGLVTAAGASVMLVLAQCDVSGFQGVAAGAVVCTVVVAVRQWERASEARAGSSEGGGGGGKSAAPQRKRD